MMVLVRRLAYAALVVLSGCSLLLETDKLGGDESTVRNDGGGAADGGGPPSSDDARSSDDAIVPVVCPPDVNLSSDAKNCGSCAHDCLGGLCSLGKCLPSIFANATGKAVGVATDGTTVYFTTLEGKVRSRAIAGGGINDVTTLARAGHLELLNGALITAADDSVLRFPLPAGSGGPQKLYTCAGQCLGVAVDPSAGKIYVGDRGPENVVRVEEDGGGTKMASGVFKSIEDLQLLGDTFYIASEGTSQILTVPRTGGVAVIYDTLEDVVAVAVDATELWAVSQKTGRILRRPLAAGGVFEVMAVNQSTPAGIAMTPKAIFWANVSDGNVMILAR